MVCRKEALIKQLNTFEHFVVKFDAGFTSCIQLNIFSAVKQLTTKNPIFSNQSTADPVKAKVWNKYVDILAEAYEELRQMHANLCKNLSSSVLNEV